MSKFLFHLRFSQKENYVHEHELYEVMRSRNLYQVQFEVRSSFKKRMRNIEISEKAHVNGFHNSRNIFVKKMKERREHADSIRDETTKQTQKSFARIDALGNKKVRRYVKLPPTPSARQDFPNLVQKLATPVEEPLPEISSATISPEIRSGRNTGRTRRTSVSSQSSLMENPVSPSMVATLYETPMIRRERERERLRNKFFVTAKAILAGKTEPTTRTIKEEEIGEEDKSSENSSKDAKESDISSDKISENHNETDLELPAIQEMNPELALKRETTNEMPKLQDIVEIPNIDNTYASDMHFFDRQIEEEDRIQDKNVSSIQFPDHLTTTENLDSETASQKVVEWATAHNLLNLSKSDKEAAEEKTFRRLLIDRPSKWAYSHIHALNESSMFENAFRASQSNKINTSFNTKTRELDYFTQKLKLKPKVTLSLPALDTVGRKPLVSMEPGGITPDGRLILTQGDYDKYLSGYRRARNMRLTKTRKKEKSLNRMVRNFHISPKLQLKDETRLFSVQSEC